MKFFCWFVLFLSLQCCPVSSEVLSLRNNFKQAKAGDFVVTAQGKSYTLLHIYSKQGDMVTIEEISLPGTFVSKNLVWRDWVKQGSPHHTSWLLYVVNLSTGEIEKCYSLSKRGWLDLSQRGETFLPTLLRMQFTYVPEQQRKKIGPSPDIGRQDKRKAWNPKMVVDGRVIPNVVFDSWRAKWPEDGGELSGKIIEIYLPKNDSNNASYPNYFPYWLQIQEGMAKANLRIVDSGSGLVTTAAPIPN